MNTFWEWFGGVTLFLLVVNALTTGWFMGWLFERGTLNGLNNNLYGEGIWETTLTWLVAVMGVVVFARWFWWVRVKNAYSQNKAGQGGNQ